MKFTLVVQAPPYSRQGSDSALRFAKAVIEQGHQLYRVFFYADGVHNGTRLAAPPQGENNLVKQWSALASIENVDMVVCIAAGLRRGVINREESERYEKDADNLAEEFELSGLGQLIEACALSDRVVTFA